MDENDDEVYTVVSKDYTKKRRRQVVTEAGLGDPVKLIGNTLHGINHYGYSIGPVANTDYHGLTFFTRPYLNLTGKNISGIRRLTPLLTSDTKTIHYAIKLLLDTKQSNEYSGEHPLTDTNQAFIPVFTNLLTSLSGWPDETLDLYTSAPGYKNEVYILADHLGATLNTFSLTATFRNIEGDPINAILSTWLTYIKGVSNGSIVPYYEMIASRTVDYQTRIYRLILDKSRRYIQKIACCGASVPVANPLGAAFNYAEAKPIVEETNEQSVPFTCVGYNYNDPIIARDFNATVRYYNPLMNNVNRPKAMVKVPNDSLQIFNFKGYPLITQNMELQWYVTETTYTKTMESLGMSPDTPKDIPHIIDADTNRGKLPWEY